MIDTDKNVYTYALAATTIGSTGHWSKATTTVTSFNDVAVKNSTTTPIKVVVAGGGTG